MSLWARSAFSDLIAKCRGTMGAGQGKGGWGNFRRQPQMSTRSNWIFEANRVRVGDEEGMRTFHGV